MSRGPVLVVDDVEANRRLMLRMLDSIGHEVAEAGNGRQALELVRDPHADPIDVVLLDILMPELDRYAPLAEMKADAELCDLPVIVISGVGELDSVVRCIRMGAADYMPHTVDPAILRARIEASLASKRLRDLEKATMRQQVALNEVLRIMSRSRSTSRSCSTRSSRPPRVCARPTTGSSTSPRTASTACAPPPASQRLSTSSSARTRSARVATRWSDAWRSWGIRPRSTTCSRNFTVFSETAEPEEALGFLRDYHAAMGHLVVAHQGTLEHFAGDGFMTFFHDPVLQPDHPARAVRMAVAMRARFEELATGWQKRGHDLEIGIGIATGYATLGRIGFEGRYDYGAIGNAIILASRLSGEAKPGQILIAKRTFAQAEDEVEAESVGEVRLKSFSRPIEAHAVRIAADRSTCASGVGS